MAKAVRKEFRINVRDPQKLEHELRHIIERVTKHVEGQFYSQKRRCRQQLCTHAKSSSTLSASFIEKRRG